MKYPAYCPGVPTYAPSHEDHWITPVMPSCGTQYERQLVKKEKSTQWKLTRLYRRAIQKHWIVAGSKPALRKILKDIYTDKKMAFSHAKETNLILLLRRIRRKQHKDKDIQSWINGLFKQWKKKFNKRKIV